MPDEQEYWRGYRAALQDLEGVLVRGWTPTADIEAVVALLNERLNALDNYAPDDDRYYDGVELDKFRARDPRGGQGANGRFETDTSYTTAHLDDGRLRLIKAGMPGDIFDADGAEGFGRHLVRAAVRLRLPSEPKQESDDELGPT